eukprot:350001-Chlamydomonas_euryale.AAC.2
MPLDTRDFENQDWAERSKHPHRTRQQYRSSERRDSRAASCGGHLREASHRGQAMCTQCACERGELFNVEVEWSRRELTELLTKEGRPSARTQKKSSTH